jgi:GT2 family glycosyltransferase
MDFSIVIPVFNREDLTQQCLATLRPTLEGAGDGEVIVVDNGSGPATRAVLAQFPWVRVVRNEKNLGFAAACNQGARAAAGRVICHLNNDIVAQPRWLANMMARLGPDVGIVGARLFFPDGRIQHAGVAMYPVRFGIEGIGPHHLYWGWTSDTPASLEPTDYKIVTGACLLTPRDLFLDLGGFDEIFWNGYEDVDYCLRVGERGLRVVYEPSATLVHFESQSGVQRKRQVVHNVRELGTRWGTRIAPDHNTYHLRSAMIRREAFFEGQRTLIARPLPRTTIVVHGPAVADPTAFVQRLRATRSTIERIVWLAEGAVPAGCLGPTARASPLAIVRALLEGRSDRYFAFVSTETTVPANWLDELVNGIEFGAEVVAATLAIDAEAADVGPCATDARCSLLNLRELPLHIRFGDTETIDGAIVDLTWQAVRAGLSVRAINLAATLGPTVADPTFANRYGVAHDVLRRPDIERLESACRDLPPSEVLASIVMLSWNAPLYTKMAVESIHAFTHCPYEIIIIDNGSGPDTIAMLRALEGVRVIYNATNMGFAHGCNQGIAAARGTHVVLLNNDVLVTEGWVERLIDVQRRDPLVGVSAPRSNRIVGHQQLTNFKYDSVEAMHVVAAERTREFAGVHYRTNRAIGFCLCISRAVITEVGGIDTRYGIGNFEDDDFCIRVRAAGYQIAVCEDVFIHHFGSATFIANKVDYGSQMERNWKIFAARWDLPSEYPTNGYNAEKAIAGGFTRERDYVALPRLEPDRPADRTKEAVSGLRASYAMAFVAVVDGESAWSRVGPVVQNYVKTLSVDDSALLAIGVTGDASASMIGARVARFIEKMNLDEQRVADIDVADVEPSELDAWLAAIPATALLSVAKDERLADLAFASDRSPSGLARMVRGEKQPAAVSR